MRHFRWTIADSVFVPSIDDEHREIFTLAEEFQQAVLTKAPKFRMREILHRIAARVEDHLAHEERVMRDQRCPSFEWHRQQHETLRKRLRKFSPGIEAGESEAASQLVEFLADWLHDHLALADRMMGAHIRNYNRYSAA